MLVAREGGSGSAKMMFRLWGNDVPVVVEGMADRLVDGLVDIPVFWCICQSLYCWYSESCSETGRYGRYFRKTFFYNVC